MGTSRLLRTHCIYCGERATARDHVPPKTIFNEPLPQNLNTVPSCHRCNNSASLDEQYFLLFLSRVCSTSGMGIKLAEGGIINRTFIHAPALELRLSKSCGFIEENGTPYIVPELERLHRIAKKIATGLFALRYRRIPIADQVGDVGLWSYAMEDQRPWPAFIATYTERFNPKPWRELQAGTFSYISVRDAKHIGKLLCIMDFYQAVWGVVSLPNPESAFQRIAAQIRLFP